MQGEKDTFETLGRSRAQHGKLNDRIYLMKLDPDDCPGIVDKLAELAGEKDYSKIFAKVPADQAQCFEQGGYEVEASVPGFFKGTTDGLFMSKFLDEWRTDDGRASDRQAVLAASHSRSGEGAPPLPEGITTRQCTEDDVEAMAEVYREVFQSYPFPIDEPEYLLETMRTHVVYFGAWEDGKLIALSSAETDEPNLNVEMTDFATLPSCRGRGLASYLLDLMAPAMKDRGIRTAYTIARAYSYGMNITFARLGYEFGGVLINNTQIGGQFESMNVWYKPLD